MRKELSKKVTAITVTAAMASGVSVPVFAAGEAGTEYAEREYAVSEFVQSVGRNSLPGNEKVLEKYNDEGDIDSEYKEDIARAMSNGILQGYDDNTIQPKSDISRVEALTILSRCIDASSEAEPIRDAIEFNDVPEWAKQYIDKLSAAGIVEGYGDGRLGADDKLTKEQVKILTDRTDDIFNTVSVGDSFYGYINNKTFRNAKLESTSIIDAKHGAVVTTENSWSALGDMAIDIDNKENDLLEKLMNGEIEYKDGTPEQRIHDFLLCLQNGTDLTDEDKALYSEIRTRILNAKNVQELIDSANEIGTETGINPLFDIAVGFDTETNRVLPSISLASVGYGGIIAYLQSAKRDFSDFYKKAVKDYLKACNVDFTDADINKAIEIQETSDKDVNFAQNYAGGLLLRQMIDESFTDEEYEKKINEIVEEHPDVDRDTYESSNITQKTYTSEEASKSLSKINPVDILKTSGFENTDNIIFSYDNAMKSADKIFTDENLNALKINALIKIGMNFGSLNGNEEVDALETFSTLSLAIIMQLPLEDDDSDDDNQDYHDDLSESIGEDKDDILSQQNLMYLTQYLPTDIGMMYCNNYYSQETTKDVQKMVNDILAAYRARFEKNTWMSEETKKNAIKKLDNMAVNIGYTEVSSSPVILSPENGGTYFNNMVRIQGHQIKEYAEYTKDSESIRHTMLMAPDTVNAYYMPMFNSITIIAAILNSPAYDKDRSYAENLGAIGAVIGHEIGHAFDNNGSRYDEIGRMQDWWTAEDASKYEGKVKSFEEYYKNFEVVDGVVQDSEITIGENMADFAGMQCVMDILGGDKEAQKAALESYAGLWARLGTEKSVTNKSLLNDVHSANNVRVDAVVASLDAYYNLYDVSEDDAMYVAPENRLNLW